MSSFKRFIKNADRIAAFLILFIALFGACTSPIWLTIYLLWR